MGLGGSPGLIGSPAPGLLEISELKMLVLEGEAGLRVVVQFVF